MEEVILDLNFKKSFGIFIIVFLILIILPSSYASNKTIPDVCTNDRIDENSTIQLSQNDLNSYSNDYYFNSSHNQSGDGSIYNPYNKLTVNRIRDYSTIHLANGEYFLEDGKTLDDVTFIGEDSEKTIVRYIGDSGTGVFNITNDGYLTLKNITFIGFNFNIMGANFEASNCIFKDTLSSLIEVNSSNVVNSGSDSFGGVIYADLGEDDYYCYFPSVVLNNCTFINNTAKYGGAIHISSGALDIFDSQFIDNNAYSYGGALVALDETEVQITNSRFINDKSLKNAGGAIYLLQSQLSSYNMTIINCSATFGGAITALSSQVSLDIFYAINNSAEYNGGAIYQMYNNTNISNSYFINNTANNGGAIFVDDLETLRLVDNYFNENKAKLIAGAVYSLLTHEFNEEGNNYYGNEANVTNDLYQCDDFVFDIEYGNYTLIYSNYTSGGSLPKKYVSDFVTSIKDQKNGGNCWAFAAIAALESSIFKASGLNLDLSENNMKNIISLYSDYGWSELTNEGGYDDMAIGYLTSWLGPVFEYQDEYDDFSMLSTLFDSFTHVQNIIYLSRDNFNDNDAIKQAILDYGAVVTGIYFDDNSYDETYCSHYYSSKATSTNHAVAIVGWNDNYSRYNFVKTPSKNGAWIVKNSWDTDWGDEGYFYVSYYDTSVARIGHPDDCYAFVFNDSEKYDNNYQYDIIGKTDFYQSDYKTVWIENIFEAKSDELLAAVSTYFRKTTDYELSIYLNDEFILSKTGTCIPGYITINLGKYIALKSGDKFKVMFKLTCEDGAEFAVSENIYANKLFYGPRVSFYSNDGIKWKDLYSSKLWYNSFGANVAAIKAFTKDCDFQPDIQYDISVYHNIVNIVGNVSDLNYDIIYNGDVLINIDGIDYFATIENSKINFTHVFDSIGNHIINITYNNFNISTVVGIEQLDIDLASSINISNGKVTIDFESSANVNMSLTVIVNNIDSYNINLINGKNKLVIDDIYEYYMIHVFANNEDYVCNYTNAKYKSKIIANDLISDYSLDNSYSIELKDCFNRPLAYRQVSFLIEDETYHTNTDNNGVATISFKLKNRNVKSLTILFDEEEDYFAFNITVDVKIRSTIMFLNSIYVANTKYDVFLFDSSNNPLSVVQFNVFINGASYWYVTDNQGRITIPLNFALGTYQFKVYNHITGEDASQTIRIVPRIVENQDTVGYYLSNTVYKVRINGNNGIPVGKGETVKFTVNNKNYYVTTDKNGYAFFKISFKPNTYKITATYKEGTVSNKIIIKPLLTAKNISKKKSKKIKFQAKLVNTKGQAVKGKKITFKIKGKQYNAKTNAKGIATVYIKNLKVGKYMITTKYGKSVIKNTIKIKR